MKIRQLTRFINTRHRAGSEAENRSGKGTAGSWITALSTVTDNLSTLETKTEQVFLQVEEKAPGFPPAFNRDGRDGRSGTGPHDRRGISTVNKLAHGYHRRAAAPPGNVQESFREDLAGAPAILRHLALRILVPGELQAPRAQPEDAGFFHPGGERHLQRFRVQLADRRREELSESVKEKSIEMKRKTDDLLVTISTTLSDMTTARRSRGQTEMMLQHIESNHAILTTKPRTQQAVHTSSPKRRKDHRQHRGDRVWPAIP